MKKNIHLQVYLTLCCLTLIFLKGIILTLPLSLNFYLLHRGASLKTHLNEHKGFLLILLANMHSDSMLLCYMFSIMIFIIILGTVLYVEQHKKIILSLEFLKLTDYKKSFDM